MTKDMTQGSPLKLILAFAVPLMLGSLFQQFYNLADTIIVGRFVGVEALAAVGSVGGLNYLVLGFVNGIACGFSIPISWTFGAKDYKEMRRYTANTVWLSIFFAVVLTIVTVALTRSVLVWTNTPENIIDLADIYIRTIFAGIPFTLLYNVTSALMRALGDSKRPLYFLLVASFLNIGLDLVCIIMFQMGAFGAAFATVVSQAVAGIGSLIYIMRHYPELRWSREEGCFSLTHCAKLCSMGIPMGLQCSITAIGSVVLQGAVNGLGSDIVAAQTAGGKAAQFLSVPLESIGTAMTTYASQNMGAKDLDRVDRGVYTALGIGCVYSIASFLILRVTDKLLIGLFLDASDAAIRRRYKETRRVHPMTISEGIPVSEAITKERQILQPLRERAKYVIDTSLLSTAQNRERVSSLFLQKGQCAMSINVVSFGFKYGLPQEADIVFDVRCLPNPFYVPELKHKTGLDQDVVDFVMSHPEAQELLKRYENFLQYALPLYVKEGKSQLTIAVGCTGGKHRSITFARKIGEYCTKLGYQPSVQHRDARRTA